MDPCEYLRLMQPVLEYLRRQNAGGQEEPAAAAEPTVAVLAAAVAVGLLHFGWSSAQHYLARRARRRCEGKP